MGYFYPLVTRTDLTRYRDGYVPMSPDGKRLLINGFGNFDPHLSKIAEMFRRSTSRFPTRSPSRSDSLQSVLAQPNMEFHQGDGWK